MTAFSEKSLFEQGRTTDSFYATGSKPFVGSTPGAFSSALKDKTQIKMTFPVNNKVRMLPNSSSIYYFDFSQSQWLIPQDAVEDFTGVDASFAVNTQPTTPGGPGNTGSIFVEDERWFDHRGNCIASGSLNIFRPTSPTQFQQRTEEESRYADATINNVPKTTVHLTNDYPKSSQRNQDYNAPVDQTFTLPIDEPFLIEKVVFEIPFCMGRGWFEDKSALTLMSASGAGYTLDNTQEQFQTSYTSLYNQGGPGVTVSLCSQKNYVEGKIRDLICRGLVTHTGDTDKQIRLIPIFSGGSGIGLSFNDGSYDFESWQVTLLGMDPTEAAATVSSSSIGQFTGSVIVKSTADVSNGTRIRFANSSIFPSNLTTRVRYFTNLVSSRYISLVGTITGIDPFGRGGTGFSPSGGSIFGREYATFGEEVINRAGDVKNPFYIEDETKRQQAIDYATPLFSQDPQRTYAPAYIFLGTRSDSPYLVYPGEKLVLAASKTRPAILGFGVNVNSSVPNAVEYGIGNLTTSSYLSNISDPNGHDIQFNTGSINITFYGSYVREGKKYSP